MAENIEAQTEEIVEEQPKVCCLSKIKLHKFKILSGVLGILVFAGAVFGAYKIGQKQIQLTPQPTPTLMGIPTLTPTLEVTPILTPTPTPVVIATPTPIPDPTADWKTYTNATYGYSIKHPSNYTLESCRSCLDLSTAPFVTFTPPQLVGYGVIKIENVRDKEQNETTNEYLEDISTIDANPIILGSKKRFKLNGIETLTTTTKSFGYESKNLFLIYSNKGFFISFTGVSSRDNKDLLLKDYKNIADFNLMLSTFKFLE